MQCLLWDCFALRRAPQSAANNFRCFLLQDGYEPAHQDTRFDMWVQTDEAYALNETDARQANLELYLLNCQR